ncbi:venom allergen 5.01 [Amyelois transitella]|uniref:venom allergen 5.01 n=1 Tax=Amyelois transitella TaxID=680683 RepID=UPI00067E1E2B|nr:venom allergen 5.01 [Amyelois transitella]
MHLRAIIILSIVGCALSAVQLSCNQISELVDGHNARRLKLAHGEVKGQPPAEEMKYLIWDDELAAKASKWASKNNFQHNPDNTIGSGRFLTGENIYMFSTTNSNQKFNTEAALDSWFNEYKDYTYGPLMISDFANGNGPQIGHYTQMAWSNSVYVGCGISKFSKNPGWYSYFLVCNYGPAGNIIGKAPYQSGVASHKLICGVSDCSQPYGDKCPA